MVILFYFVLFGRVGSCCVLDLFFYFYFFYSIFAVRIGGLPEVWVGSEGGDGGVGGGRGELGGLQSLEERGKGRKEGEERMGVIRRTKSFLTFFYFILSCFFCPFCLKIPSYSQTSVWETGSPKVNGRTSSGPTWGGLGGGWGGRGRERSRISESSRHGATRTDDWKTHWATRGVRERSISDDAGTGKLWWEWCFFSFLFSFFFLSPSPSPVQQVAFGFGDMRTLQIRATKRVGLSFAAG